MSQVAKNEKPTVGFWCAFFAKKCILRCFLGPPPKSGLQAARNQPFTNEPKTRRLYDTDDFPNSAVFGHFLRNLVEINRIGAKNASFKTLQILVTYNTCLSGNLKKRAFLVPQFSAAKTPQIARQAVHLSSKKGLILASKSLLRTTRHRIRSDAQHHRLRHQWPATVLPAGALAVRIRKIKRGELTENACIVTNI